MKKNLKIQALVMTGILLIYGILLMNRLGSENVRIWQFDVGQGDSALIETAEKQYILIDGGPDRKIIDRLAGALPFRFKKIDLVIITHPHADHVDGIYELIDEFEIKYLIHTGVKSENKNYQKILEKAAMKNIKIIIADGKSDFKFGSVILDMLYPTQSLMNMKLENQNNGSIVFRLIYGKNIYYFSGDLENEHELTKLSNLDLKAQIMKAGHHGSRTSNSIDLLKQVKPEWLIISCGKNNKFNHPAPETLNKAGQIGAKIWRTDLKGNFEIEADGMYYFLGDDLE